MSHPTFNPAQQIRFDVGRGQVSMDGDALRVVIPAEALADLLKHAGGEAAKDFGRRLGTEVGRRVADRLSGPNGASVEAVVEHLGGDLAIIGLGSLTAERWGNALVMRIAGSPFGAEGDSVLAAVLEGAIQRAMARDVAMVPLERADGAVRLVAVSPASAELVQGWLSEGVAWGEALSRLNEGAHKAG